MSKSKSSNGNRLDSSEKSNTLRNERSHTSKRDRNNTIPQNSSTIWKNISKLFNKNKARQKVPLINVSKEKECSGHRLSSFLRSKKLSQNSLVPVTTIGESPTGYQAAFTQKTSNSNNEKVTVMTIKLPDGITTDNVDVTLELSVIKSDTKNSETSATQEPMTMYCTEENAAQTTFTGILKVPNETEIMNLLNMPLYLIDSSENVVLNGSEVTHRKIVRTSKEISYGNPFQEIEVDNIKLKLTFERISNGSNVKRFSSSMISEENQSDSVCVAEDSDEMVITVNSYNVSEISSILKGKPISNDESKLIKDGSLETSNVRELVESAIIHIIEPKEKTEDILVEHESNENKKLSDHHRTTQERSKKSVPILNKEPEIERIKEMTTQYSHSYFTSNKETNTELLGKELSMHLVEPQPQNVYVTESIEIKDFTYFDQILEEDTLARNSRSTTTPWLLPDGASVSESATLLSSISDCGYYNKMEFETNHDCDKLKNLSSTDVVLNAREELLESALLCITLKEPMINNYDESETIDNLSVTSLKALNNEDSLILSFRSDTQLEKEGKTEDFSTIRQFNKMSIKSVDKLFEYLEGTRHENFEDRYIDAFNPEETRKTDVRLGKNPFHFPEREFDEPKESNKRYYEDNDEFYEKHREGIQNFFQDRELTLDNNYQLTKSKKNHDLYLGDIENNGLANLKSKCVSVEDLECVIAVHDEVGVHTARALSGFNNFAVAANFVHEGESSKFLATASQTNINKEKGNDSNQCEEKDIIVKHKRELREFKSSSNSIVFKVDGEVQLKTKESCNSCSSKKTIMLDSRKSTVRINESKEVECSINTKNFENHLSNSNGDADSTLNDSPANQINDELLDLDQNNSKVKNKEVGVDIAYCLFSEHRQILRNYISKMNRPLIYAQIPKPLSSLSSNQTKTYNLEFHLETENVIGKNNLVTSVKDAQMDTLINGDYIIRIPVEEKKSLSLTGIYSEPLENPKNAQICIPFLYKQSTGIEPNSKSRINDSRLNVKINKYSINTTQNYNSNVPIDGKVNDLRDCLMKINETLITGASMPLLNTKFNIITDTPTDEKNNADLSQERQKTYQMVESDIKQAIQELLKESKDIKESVILKGAIEEFESPFVADYVKKEPIDYTSVMGGEIGEMKQKSITCEKKTALNKIKVKENKLKQNIDKILQEKSDDEIGIKLPDVDVQQNRKDTFKPNEERELGECLGQEIRSLIDSIIDDVASRYSHLGEQKILEARMNLPRTLFDEQNTQCITKKYPNSFKTNNNNVNIQMTYFCNSDPFHSKIPKTCHSFGKVFDNLSNNNDEMCPNNSIECRKNENVSYLKNEVNNNSNINLVNTYFESEHSFAEDHKPPMITENIESIFPCVSSDQDNIIKNPSVEIIECVKVPDLNQPLESVIKVKTVLSTTYEEDCPTESPGKGVPKCKKEIKLSDANNMQITNDNLPSTSTPYMHHRSTEEEEFLNDIDFTNQVEFLAEQEEEEKILLTPKFKGSSSRTFIKDGMFTGSSSDEDISEFHTRLSNASSMKEQYRQNANFSKDQSQESLQVKPPIFNLHEKLEAESSNSMYSVQNFRILNARRSSDASDADDENENPRISFTLPKHRYKSNLELNSAQELADIEKNLQDNDVLIRKKIIIVPFKNNHTLTRIASNTSSLDSTITDEEEIKANPSEPVETPQVR